ncbi:hypothetical protein HanXRQr2_Chr01g0012751 [Helianthus annuus]|uniref:Uncharacterized protein n=1 Tax=Helianthus annuus TaxID=4232 RepID=A0A9K3JVB6_HELAN|nr:scarecrow-like protein 9 [Helianthus annuus]KAF5821335.1 hypothetical protein HanXRQr2_Chr01g0012751 [Helianthus annuus]KAJ0611019.1 hypothetical protein HanHA300_Chr01g0010441 [Helianthus annuus]KAJ0621921.1 hypothetical protein HanIR_Chr01g0014231 [Helianthus annuus]KAJ0626287.1 hypothetical protein HanHA89_Chr01g0011431 [Helianthus annuus]
MFDDMLLCVEGKGRGKKGVNKDVVELRMLLTLCAQAVAANDQRGAFDLLNQILVLQMTMEDGFKNSTATEELHGDGS